jgi:GxxExxY protein
MKAVEKIAPPHIAQVLNYLKATNMQIGIIANFGEASFSYKRIIL